VESGFSDGIALAALLAAVALASARVDPNPGQWAWFAFRTEVVSLLMGVGIGLIGGLLVVWSRRRGWMSDIWAQLATLAIALICAATPTAPNSYVLARELGGDTTLAANFIAAQTLLAALTLPLTWLVILGLGAV
jgi:predicted permease